MTFQEASGIQVRRTIGISILSTVVRQDGVQGIAWFESRFNQAFSRNSIADFEKFRIVWCFDGLLVTKLSVWRLVVLLWGILWGWSTRGEIQAPIDQATYDAPNQIIEDSACFEFVLHPMFVLPLYFADAILLGMVPSWAWDVVRSTALT